eukprot:COSAG06_NODE_4006_length_4669_cov_3.911160_6_plen_80_part_00
MATPKHTPNGRGYSSTLNYWTHKNDFWTMISAQDSCSQPITDLWQSNVTHPMGAPAFHLVRTLERLKMILWFCPEPVLD